MGTASTLAAAVDERSLIEGPGSWVASGFAAKHATCVDRRRQLDTERVAAAASADGSAATVANTGRLY